MRGFLAVLRRELAERRFLLLIALAAGLFALAAPLLPSASRLSAADVRSGTALGLCLVVTTVLALVLGGSVIARDLAEGRLGFYFSRPITGWAVWAGKLAAAAVLTLGAGFLVLLPSLLTGGVEVRSWWDGGEVFGSSVLAAVLAGTGVLLLLLLVAHAVSLMVRSRSPWLLLDLLAAPLVGSLVLGMLRQLAREGALGVTVIVGPFVAASLVLALLAGGAVQVIYGRTDLRRGHRFLSFTLWGVLLASSLACQAFTHWLVAAAPADLAEIHELQPAPSGPWIGLNGPARNLNGFVPSFVLDTGTGRSFRLRTPWGLSSLSFAADGSRAVWLEPAGGIIQPRSLSLFRLDLQGPDLSPRETTISYDRYPRLVLSADGRRLASLWGRRLTVEELDSGRLLATAELDTDFAYGDHLRFASPSRLLLYRPRVDDFPGKGLRYQIRIFELDLAGGGLRQAGTVEGPGAPVWEVSGDGRLFLVRESRSRTLRTFDPVSGAALAAQTLPDGNNFVSRILADGRIAVQMTGDGWRELRFFTPGLVEIRRFRFPAVRGLRLGGQPAPDLLVVSVATREEEKAPAGWEARVLDLATGEARVLGPDLLPAAPLTGPASIGPRLFQGEGHELVAVDPATGRRRRVLGEKSTGSLGADGGV